MQGVAHAPRAACLASNYAKERTQGRLAKGEPARLSDHDDVQRMLKEQQTLTHSARAMCHLALVELERNARPALIEILTPLCKIAGSEAGTQSADLAIQILGGYGYLKEYGVEQIWRDARITSIYEGANGIHAKSFVTRGLRLEGATEEFSAIVNELSNGDRVVNAALDQWQNRAVQLASVDNPQSYANEFARETIEVLQKAIWIRIAEAAHFHPDVEAISRLASDMTHKVSLRGG